MPDKAVQTEINKFKQGAGYTKCFVYLRYNGRGKFHKEYSGRFFEAMRYLWHSKCTKVYSQANSRIFRYSLGITKRAVTADTNGGHRGCQDHNCRYQ